MNVKFDVNDGLKHPETRKTTNRIIIVVLIVGVVFTGVVIYSISRGKHVKIPGVVEVGDAPKDSITKITTDNSRKINVTNGDYVEKDKIVNEQRTSNKSKDSIK